MSKILAYLRTSTDKQDNDNQRLEIYDFAHDKNMKVDEVIQVQVSSSKGRLQRRIDELMEKNRGRVLVRVNWINSSKR